MPPLPMKDSSRFSAAKLSRPPAGSRKAARAASATAYLESLKNEVDQLEAVLEVLDRHQGLSDAEIAMALKLMRTFVMARWQEIDRLWDAKQINVEEYGEALKAVDRVTEICVELVRETPATLTVAAVPASTKQALHLYGLIMRKWLTIVASPAAKHDGDAPPSIKRRCETVYNAIDELSIMSGPLPGNVMLLTAIVEELCASDVPKDSEYSEEAEEAEEAEDAEEAEEAEDFLDVFDRDLLPRICRWAISHMVYDQLSLALWTHFLRLMTLLTKLGISLTGARPGYRGTCMITAVLKAERPGRKAHSTAACSVFNVIDLLEKQLLPHGFHSDMTQLWETASELRKYLAQPNYLEMLPNYELPDAPAQTFERKILNTFERRYQDSGERVMGALRSQQPQGPELRVALTYLRKLHKHWSEFLDNQSVYYEMNADRSDRMKYLIAVCRFVKDFEPHAHDCVDDLTLVLHTALELSAWSYNSKSESDKEHPLAVELIQLFLGPGWRLLRWEDEDVEESRLESEEAWSPARERATYVARIGRLCPLTAIRLLAKRLAKRLAAVGDDTSYINYLLFFLRQLITGGRHEESQDWYVSMPERPDDTKRGSQTRCPKFMFSSRPATEFTPVMLHLIEAICHFRKRSFETPALIIEHAKTLVRLLEMCGYDLARTYYYPELTSRELVKRLSRKCFSYLLRIIRSFPGQRISVVCLPLLSVVVRYGAPEDDSKDSAYRYQLASMLLDVSPGSLRWTLTLPEVASIASLLIRHGGYRDKRLLEILMPHDQLERPESKTFESALAILNGILMGFEYEYEKAEWLKAVWSGVGPGEPLPEHTKWKTVILNPDPAWSVDVHLQVFETLSSIQKIWKDDLERSSRLFAAVNDQWRILSSRLEDPKWTECSSLVKYVTSLASYLKSFMGSLNNRPRPELPVRLASDVVSRVLRQTNPDDKRLSPAITALLEATALMLHFKPGKTVILAAISEGGIEPFVAHLQRHLSEKVSLLSELCEALETHPAYARQWRRALGMWCAELIKAGKNRSHSSISAHVKSLSSIVYTLLQMLMT